MASTFHRSVWNVDGIVLFEIRELSIVTVSTTLQVFIEIEYVESD